MLEKIESEILKLTKNFVNNNKSFKIIVSISGGQDSILLMKMLEKISTKFKEKILVRYIYIDHQWKTNSYQQIEHIANYVKSLKSKLIIYQIKESTISEKECRIQRYHLINKHAVNYRYDLIITGHHFNDKIETFFQNVFRGCGIEGLSSPIVYNRINKKVLIAKPLLHISKENIYWLCKKLYLPIWSDSTNYIYLINRNRIRHELIPYLSNFLSIGINKNIINLVYNYYYENEYIKQSVNKLYLKSRHETKVAIHYKNLVKQHLIIQVKTIQVFCLHSFQAYFEHQKIVRMIYKINQLHAKKKQYLKTKILNLL